MPCNSDNPTTLDEVIQQLQAGGTMPAELLEIYAEEADDHLRTIYEGISRLQADCGDTNALANVRRASHTLKGAAGAVGLEAATRLAHRMEDLLDRLANNRQDATGKQIQLLLLAADKLQELTTGEIDIETFATGLVELYADFAAEMQSVPQPAASIIEPETSNSDLTTTPDPGEQPDGAIEPVIETAPHGTAANEQKKAVPAALAEPTQYLRVPLRRLDEMVSVVGEMVVNRSALHQKLADFQARIDDMQIALDRMRGVTLNFEARYGSQTLQDTRRWAMEEHRPEFNAVSQSDDNCPTPQEDFDSLEFDQYTESHLLARTLAEANNDVEMVTEELQHLRRDLSSLIARQQQLNREAQTSLMHIRMVPLSGITSRLERTVRSVASKLGRDVQLEVRGASTEFDKTVLDEITDPLVHLIRNAIDHGIEPAEVRAAAGKSTQARLQIEALNQGTQVSIRITDDGSGIDLEKVRNQALSKGLIREDQSLTSNELQALIFMPGFSTATTLTDVSGRGVGMDVVRDAVTRLNGTIRVESEPGRGTTFTIQLPAKLGVTRALLVKSNGKTFAISMPAVRQIQRVDQSSVRKTGQDAAIDVQGRSVRVISLAEHLQLASDKRAGFSGSTTPMPIIHVGGEEVAVAVDSIEGGQDIVVKTLGDHLKNVPGVIGATIRGDGSILPILDPAGLVGINLAIGNTTTRQQYEEPRPTRHKTAMVIDDSISVRRVTTDLLRSAGWDVVSAKDGVDALEKLHELDIPPDVFLCDMEMPRMDGIELIRRIRKQNEFETTPIVMVTSRASEKHRHKAIDAGATDYVVKPFQDEQLLELIGHLVQSVRETVNA